MTDALNDILIECCKMRGCYPLMHRTLHEFDWFVSAVIFGAPPTLDLAIRQAEDAGDFGGVAALKKQRDEENRLKERFKEDCYRYTGDDELIRLAEAFRVYCKEQYGPIQVFSRDCEGVNRDGER